MYGDDDGFKEVRRSTGRGYLICAAIGAAISVFSIAAALMIEPYEVNAASNRIWWATLSYAAGGTAALSFIVGSIVRAIWFLPGDEIKELRRIRR